MSCSANARRLLLAVLVCLIAIAPALALRDPGGASRFADRVVEDPSQGIGIRTSEVSSLGSEDALGAGWEAFKSEHGGRWKVWLDERSGLPSLAYGRGIAWVPGSGNDLESDGAVTLDGLEALAREFLSRHATLLGSWDGELVLDREASGDQGTYWQVTFRQEVGGVRVEEARFDFQVSQGNLVAFGVTQWGPVSVDPEPSVGREGALEELRRHLGVESFVGAEFREEGRLALLALDPSGERGSAWEGARGLGFTHRLVWRYEFAYPGEAETWVGKVDAHSGEVVAFYDDTKYDRIKGGVHPLTNDGSSPEAEEQPDYPMPFVDYSEDGGADVTSGDGGLYQCSTLGSTIETNLVGPYVRISDQCGAVSETTTCDGELDLGLSPGIDCQVEPGASAGNTGGARSCFYHVNRVKQLARSWLPTNSWLQAQLNCRSNVNSTCNATYNGNLNMYRDGGSGCRNTAENQGVVVHEWGHGMDSNDGGGTDNPGEAYADVVAILYARISCVGPGFFKSQTCSGYGDTCLECTGIRDMDWDMRESHTPATPSVFEANNCGGGGSPCGKETHCASYVPSESIFDLAYRDLPAMGLDADTSWQLVDRLFYVSRAGSGGPTFNCSLPSSDGCGTQSWFHKLRVADDDDGDLSNGTPHAEAIFAAFDRHDIACGQANDQENQNSSSCPTLAAPGLTLTARSNAVELNWTAVTDAASYRVLRSDLGCHRSQLVVDEVASPGLSYLDDELPNDFPVYYRVQAIGANAACTGPVSTCESAAPQPFAGTVRFDQETYGCSNRVGIQVKDANVGASTVMVSLWSDTEPTPETVVLTETEPGSSKFLGEIFTTGGAPAADGLLSTTDGDTVTVQYVDADDGAGGTNIPVLRTALSDCVFPHVSGVQATGVTDTQATISWLTDEGSDTQVVWGENPPPDQTSSKDETVTSHAVLLTGLQSCTVYYYQVQSTDPAGNVAVSDNNGLYFRFETQGDFGQGLQPCHDGQLTVEAPVVSCHGALPVEVIDIDLNVDSLVADTVTVTVSSTTEITPETLWLTETGPNTSIFTGAMATASGPPVSGDGILQASHDDILTATYRDADEGSGTAGVSFDTGVADCAGAGFSSVQVINITDSTAQVRWTTTEPSIGRVEWGATPALGSTASSGALQTTHTVTLSPVDECGRTHFRIVADDQYGNTTVSDAGGIPYAFNASEIGGAVFKDGFEGTTGWTLEGEWEIDSPLGLGSGNGDPSAAFAGMRVLGHDLTGQGAAPGDYEARTTESATGPAVDVSALTSVELKFRRWLNVALGSIASVKVKVDGTWQSVWQSNSSPTETAWSYQTIDISEFAAGNASLEVRFEQFAGVAGSTGAGWNVDRFIVRDATQPEFVSCGACGGPPTFAGISSASDGDPCADSGVVLDWEPVPSWGTGSGGTFVIYRDVVPDFTPSVANQVASGVAGTGWTDTGAPIDVTLYYLVRAENNENCAAGPNNGGLMDDNLVYRSARDEVSQPAPGDVGDTLRAIGVNDAHVRLSWDATPGAASYNVYRSNDPQGGFGLIGAPVATFLEDPDQFTDTNSYYYLTRAADACGNEGP